MSAACPRQRGGHSPNFATDDSCGEASPSTPPLPHADTKKVAAATANVFFTSTSPLN
jgi:hypothetical protein